MDNPRMYLLFLAVFIFMACHQRWEKYIENVFWYKIQIQGQKMYHNTKYKYRSEKCITIQNTYFVFWKYMKIHFIKIDAMISNLIDSLPNIKLIACQNFYEYIDHTSRVFFHGVWLWSRQPKCLPLCESYRYRRKLDKNYGMRLNAQLPLRLYFTACKTALPAL